MRLAANLGFLWTELDLPDAILAAGRAGFGAVECHYPYESPPQAVAAALAEAGIPMLGLNTVLGGPGEFGLAALSGRVAEAREAIDQAIEYGAAIGAGHVSVIGGVTGRTDAAEATYRESLRYAADHAGEKGMRVVIEPLSQRAVPGAHLSRLDDALETLQAVSRYNLSIMLDVFHTHSTEGPYAEGTLAKIIGAALPAISHIQFASVPDRSEPDHGDVNFTVLLPELQSMGYTGWFGAEYRPRTTTDEGLGWMTSFRAETREDDKHD